MLQHDVLEATSGANQRHVVLPCMADGFERALCVAIRGRGAMNIPESPSISSQRRARTSSVAIHSKGTPRSSRAASVAKCVGFFGS